jgi:hypothetical protein
MHFDAHISRCLSCSLFNCGGKKEGNNTGFLGPLIGLFLSLIQFPLSSGIEARHRYYLPKIPLSQHLKQKLRYDSLHYLTSQLSLAKNDACSHSR